MREPASLNQVYAFAPTPAPAPQRVVAKQQEKVVHKQPAPTVSAMLGSELQTETNTADQFKSQITKMTKKGDINGILNLWMGERRGNLLEEAENCSYVFLGLAKGSNGESKKIDSLRKDQVSHFFILI